jgi:hypothetical protein
MRLKLCVCVCMFAYSARTYIPPCTKHGILIPWDQAEVLETWKLRKIVLSSNLGKGCKCSSETGRNRRTAQEQSCLPRRGDNRNEGQNPGEISRVRISVKIFYVAPKLTTTEEQGQEHSCSYWWRDWRKNRPEPEKVTWLLASVEVILSARQLSSIEVGNPTRTTQLSTFLSKVIQTNRVKLDQQISKNSW